MPTFSPNIGKYRPEGTPNFDFFHAINSAFILDALHRTRKYFFSRWIILPHIFHAIPSGKLISNLHQVVF